MRQVDLEPWVLIPTLKPEVNKDADYHYIIQHYTGCPSQCSKMRKRKMKRMGKEDITAVNGRWYNCLRVKAKRINTNCGNQ